MHHRPAIILVLLCFAGIFLACFAGVLFQGQQFGFRDSAHYYYPLYLRVQQEWDAGRWPLWEPEENAGAPLLGNPTAAVLYPPKVIFAVLPYAWATRLYVVCHTSLAFATMLVLMRSWRTSWTGSGLSALAYTFGAPILFQNCNVIYLVGAAWLPLGVHAVDRWVRLGRRWGILELAVVLAMQVLGGDPQAAYLLGLAAIAYAGGLAWHRAPARRRADDPASGPQPRRSRRRPWVATISWVVTAWIVATLALAQWLPQFRPKEAPARPLPWMWCVQPTVMAAWVLVGTGFLIHGCLIRSRRGRRDRPLARAWVGLAVAAALAAALAAAQLLPMIEFTQRTGRAADGSPHDIYPFSVEPVRLAGMIWPDFLGVTLIGNTYWGEFARIPVNNSRPWTPSLYLGCLTMVLAAGGFGVRRGPPWRVWLSWIAATSLLASLGPFTSPILVARVLARASESPTIRSLLRDLGPIDPPDTTAIRHDHYLRDGDGSIYWGMATFLPFFREFRFPAKLFTFTSLALAALAGPGWDAVGRGASRRIGRVATALLVLTAAVLVGVLIGRPAILSVFRLTRIPSFFGPFDPDGAYAAILRGLVQAALVLAVGLLAIRIAARRPGLAGALVLAGTALDLGFANARYVVTIPQSTLEAKPEILRVIEEAERAHPAPGPFRIHRLPLWSPEDWQATRSPDRVREIAAWERDTIQPKHGIPLGIEYTHTMDVDGLYEYDWFFAHFLRTINDPGLARSLDIRNGSEVLYLPRRSFDMWNTRYFVVPASPHDWRDEFRGYASLKLDGETIFPDPATFRGPHGDDARRDWAGRRDVQVIRNRREHPRAWAVHSLRSLPTTTGLRDEADRQKSMKEMMYDNDLIWSDPTRQVFDYRRIAWVDRPRIPGLVEGSITTALGRFLSWTERDDVTALAPYLGGGPTLDSESVTVTYPTPQRAELEVTLQSPGLVVLADVSYPGWELTVDGAAAPIYTVNRLMRGAALSEGHHCLVYTYNPRSFRDGKIVSAVGLVALLLLAAGCFLRPVDPVVGASSDPSPSEGPIND